MRMIVTASLAAAAMLVSACTSVEDYRASGDKRSYCAVYPERCVIGGILLIGGVIALALAANDDDGVPAVVVSDRRLKTDLVHVGKTPNGLPVYTYRYIGGTERFSGVLAQDVLKRPDLAHAVVKGQSGYLGVDYAALDLNVVNASQLSRAGKAAIASASAQ